MSLSLSMELIYEGIIVACTRWVSAQEAHVSFLAETIGFIHTTMKCAKLMLFQNHSFVEAKQHLLEKMVWILKSVSSMGLYAFFYELFHLPTAEQCTEWWRRNAAHLGALRGEGMRGLFDLVRTGSHAHLGRASVGLSFRGLESVADTVSLQDATKADAKSPADCPLEPTMHDIKKDIGRVKQAERVELKERLMAVAKFAAEVQWRVMSATYLARDIGAVFRARL